MNAAVCSLDKQMLKAFVIAVLLIFTTLPCVMQTDTFSFIRGFSMVWLCVLYIVGAYIGKYGISMKRKTSFTGFVIMILLTYISKLTIGDMFFSYASPTITLAALFLLFIFSQAKIKNKYIIQMISTFAPATLGVYIIHEHPLIREKFIKGFAVPFAVDSSLVLVGKVLLSAFAIYLSCSIVDILRIQIFKIIKIDKLCGEIDLKINGRLRSTENKK